MKPKHIGKNFTLTSASLAILALSASCSGPNAVTPNGTLERAQGKPAGAPGQETTIQQQVVLGRILRTLRPYESMPSGLHVATRSFMDPRAVGKRLVFISTFGSSGGVVDIYLEADTHQKMVGQIAAPAPEGLATEADGKLYVANSTASNVGNVLVYAPPYSKPPKRTLDDMGYFPNGVAVSRRGVVAVANFCDAPSCSGAGNVVFYRKNSTEPCATVADATNFFVFLNDAFDNRGNLYVTALDPNYNFVIGEVRGGCRATTITPLTTTNMLHEAYAVQVDQWGRIVVINYTGGSGYDVLDVYEPPKNGSLGSPIKDIEVVDGITLPVDYVFSASNGAVYTAEQGGGGVLNSFDFHGGGTPERSIVVGGAPQGVAAYPPLVP